MGICVMLKEHPGLLKQSLYMRRFTRTGLVSFPEELQVQECLLHLWGRRNRCGTTRSGWMTDDHPSVAVDGKVTKKVCFTGPTQSCPIAAPDPSTLKGETAVLTNCTA